MQLVTGARNQNIIVFSVATVPHNNIQWIIVQGDFQSIVNFINRKIEVLNGIVNLLKDVNCFLIYVSDNRIEYYNRDNNRNMDTLIKSVYL